MLVLSRKIGEKIVIGHNITVTITEIRGSKVRLGIEAPRHVSIDRSEIHLRREQDAQTNASISKSLYNAEFA